jgi:hypothetical protein
MRFFPSQGKYTVGIIKEVQYDRMQMDLKKNIDDDSNETNPQLIGSLMYLVNTKIDSCYVVNSHSMSQPKQTHSTTTKHVLRYLCGTVRYGL